jgi:histidinol-phosphate aminotransferase
MRISRRDVLTRLGLGVAASAAMSSSAGAAAAVAPNRFGPIRLDRNENAYGPSSKVIAIIERAAKLVNRYPESETEMLRREIARLHRLHADRILLGCGAGEILRVAVHAFAGPRRNVVMAVPGFDSIRSLVHRAGARLTTVPLNKDHSHDLAGMLGSSHPATGLVYLCNPNNPTGTLTPRHDIEAFLAKLPPEIFVVIDEAYEEYVRRTSDDASFIDRPVDDRRVIVVRSFSTIYGLAGMRVGYAVAAPPTARLLASSRVEEDLTALSARAAVAALHDPDHVRMSAERNADDRQEFFNQTHARMLRAIDSLTNFVMLNTGGPARHVIDHLARHDIVVAGPFGAADHYIRVSLGTPPEMREFWRAWDLMPAHAMSM